MLVLRQSTAIDIRLGPFVAIADGITPITAAQTITNWDQGEVLKENGAATVAMAGAIAAVTGCGGWYDYTVASGDVDTVGEVVFVCQDASVFLPVFVRAMVVEEAVYDEIYDATAALNVGSAASVTAGVTLAAGAVTDASLAGGLESVYETNFGTAWNGTRGAWVNNYTDIIGTMDAAAFGADFLTSAKIADGAFVAANFAASSLDGKGDWNTDKTGYSLTQSFPTNFADMAITVTTGLVSVGTLPSIPANWITAAGINAAALTAAKFDAGAIDAAALNADAAAKIRDAILPTQNATFSNIEFLFVAASDHVTPVTGASGTAVTRSIDGGAFGAGTGTLAEVGNGIYQYDASAADMNGGIITFRFTGTGGTPGAPDDAFLTIITGGGV